MALSVTSRPSKEIEGSISTWNALNLPIQYKLDSDLFPVNSVDPVISITSFDNSGGFLQVTINAASANTLTGETIQLSGCDVDSFNGVWKIKQVVSDTIFILFLSYDDSITTGDFQKYYNNYFAEVKVYGGLPSYHEDYLEKPIQEVGVLRVIPNVENKIIASFSGLLKDDVNLKKNSINGIDIDHFTGFYIEWREAYDENVSGSIVTNYEPWEIDEVNNCNSNIVTNGNFDVDLSGWSQVDPSIVGEPFIWDSSTALSNLITNRSTKVIYQALELVANASYNLTVDITRTNSEQSRFVATGSNDLVTFTTLAIDNDTISKSLSFDIVPIVDYQYLCLYFFRDSTTANTEVSIDNVTLTPNVCEYLFWGTNSALQFQNQRGGNMFEYVSGRPESKFMTNFDTPTLFDGKYYDLSFINDSSISDSGFSEFVDVHLSASSINQLDSTDLLTWTDLSPNGNDFVTISANKPQFKTSGGVNNSPNVLFSGSEYLDNLTISKDQPFIIYWVGLISSFGGAAPVIDGVDLSDRIAIQYNLSNSKWLMSAENSILLNSSPDFINGNVGKFVFDGELSRGIIDNVDETPDPADSGNGDIDKLRLGATAGVPSDFYIGDMSEFIIVSADVDPCVLINIETYLANAYGTYDVSGKAVVVNQYNKDEIIKTDNVFIDNNIGLQRFPIPSLKNVTTKIDVGIYSAGICQASEIKTINVNKDCNNQEIYLAWLNSEDGWEYWNFTAEKNHNLQIGEKDTIKRNVFADWDNDFINGGTQNDVIGIEAYKEIEVFSQFLTLDEVEAISSIKHSIRVVRLEGDIETTVIVDSNSITIFNDGEENTLHTIRFNIQLPDIQIQSQ